MSSPSRAKGTLVLPHSTTQATTAVGSAMRGPNSAAPASSPTALTDAAPREESAST